MIFSRKTPLSLPAASALIGILLAIGTALASGFVMLSPEQPMSYLWVVAALALNSLLVFGLPGLIGWGAVAGKMARLENRGELTPSLALSVVILALVSQPVVEWASYANHVICLREPFSEFVSDDSSASILAQVLCFDSVLHWVVAIVVIGILPALCEEFFFRGAILALCRKALSNWHLAVMLSAAIFSFLHLEFEAFLPRFILGAIIGALFVVTRSIWAAVIFHIANNVAVVVTFGFVGKPASELLTADPEDPGMLYPILGVVLTALQLAIIHFTSSTARKRRNGTMVADVHNLIKKVGSDEQTDALLKHEEELYEELKTKGKLIQINREEEAYWTCSDDEDDSAKGSDVTR